jgi:hypothetical protein
MRNDSRQGVGEKKLQIFLSGFRPKSRFRPLGADIHGLSDAAGYWNSEPSRNGLGLENRGLGRNFAA